MRRIFSIYFLLVAFAALAFPAAAPAQVSVGVAVSFGPPELPVYDQPICPAMAISGRRAIGRGMATITTGCREPGSSSRRRDFSGRPRGGDGEAGDFFFIPVIGARAWASTAESITAMDILAMGMREGAGITATFSITGRSTTSM